MISLEQLRTLDDLPREKVDLPEWQTDIHVHMLPAGIRHRLEGIIYKMTQEDYAERFRCLWIAHAACDEAGQPLYDDPLAAAEVFMAKSGRTVERIYDAVAKLNLLSPKATEEAAKNS